ncbi:MAG TPA: hypothetical protein DEP72_04280 [Clostridiales bacterium]|nr:MAG: hypothetical protein A2Y18_04840 [Clostridiales bacterium GWD2_32_19]HCC07358.1 hypothetical protein [Clostridiales bacterium]
MSIIFIILLVIYISIYTIRIYLMMSYQSEMKNNLSSSDCSFSEFTVIQPIVSGDRNFKNDLNENIRKSKDINFVWIIDYNDNEAREIVNEIKSISMRDITIIVCDEIPKNLNAKVYKQKLGLKYCKKYMIALDDDSIIDFSTLPKIKELLDAENCIVTGTPYYSNYNGILSRLVTGFVNGNSLLTYLPMSKLGLNNTINGMCYFAKTELMKEYEVFSVIEDKLCDEYEIAKLMLKNKIKTIQHTVPCRVGTTISGIRHYCSLMKRWMIFANKYLKDNIHPLLIILVVFPSIMPLMLLTVAIGLGLKYIFIFVTIHYLKSIINLVTRKKYLNSRENIFAPLFEMISDYVQPIHYIHSLISPNKIQWRKNSITIQGEKLEYNKTL